MEQISAAPQTLQQAILYFGDLDRCHAFLAAQRWPDGKVKCPQCGSEAVTFLATQKRWKCRTQHPRQQFSIKVGTIFEDSPIGLDKWLVAMWMLANCKNGISSYEVGRALGVTQKTGWFMLHRIRLAMEDRSITMLRGKVEADEAYIGGRVANMHKVKRDKVMKGRRGSGIHTKAVVLGILERGGKVRARVMPGPAITRREVTENIEWFVQKGAEVMTDGGQAYAALGDKQRFIHQFVDHINEYVRGAVHTNGIENFWALLKRGLKGTYVSTEPFHLHRYVDEQAWRFNERESNDGNRFVRALRTILGRRLTYGQLTGAVATT